jgi:hypothetical protein
MIRAYDEIVDLIASGSGPAAVAAYRASSATREIVARLLESEKAGTLSADESLELDHYMRLEHVMRLAKARAHARLSNE